MSSKIKKPNLSRKEEQRIKVIASLKKICIATIVFAVASPLTSIGYMVLYDASMGRILLIVNIIVFMFMVASTALVLKTNNGLIPKPTAHRAIITIASLITAAWELIRFLFGIIIVVLCEDSNSVTSQKVSSTTGTTSQYSGVDNTKVNFGTVYKIIIIYIVDILMIVAGLILIMQIAGKYKALYWSLEK
jgi:hypothetical protein